MSPEQWTIAGLLTAALATGMRGMWVFGWVYQAAIKDAQFWRDRALAGTGLAEMATDVAQEKKP